MLELTRIQTLTAIFALPSVNDITGELRKLGCGTLLYKVDVSHAFCHVKVDLGDYNLLGLEWHSHCMDACILFGTCHGSQIFRSLSDGVRFAMCQKGYTITDYIDYYIGISVPSIMTESYAALINLMNDHGLTISQKMLVISFDSSHMPWSPH